MDGLNLRQNRDEAAHLSNEATWDAGTIWHVYGHIQLILAQIYVKMLSHGHFTPLVFSSMTVHIS